MQSVHNRKLAEKENEIKKLTTLKTELEKRASCLRSPLTEH